MTVISQPAPAAHQDVTVTFEPLYVVFILVFALWTTRSWPGIGCNAERPAMGGSLQGISQLLKRLPFANELLRFVLVLIVYRLCAYLCYLIWGGDTSQALSNALFLVKAQHSLALGWVEKVAQDIAWHRPWLMVFLNRVYKHCHIPGGATFLTVDCSIYGTDLSLIAFRKATLICADIYRAQAVNFVAFVCFTVFPCTPPRLIPSLGIIDTMHTAPYGLVNEFQDTRFANQHAAVPSMHIGWSTLVTCGLALALSRRRAREREKKAASERRLIQLADSLEDVERPSMPQELTQSTERDDASDDLAALSDVELWQRYGPLNAANLSTWMLCSVYSFVVLFSVLATGNHFWLDAVAGLGADLIAYFGTRRQVIAAVQNFVLPRSSMCRSMSKTKL